MGFSPCQNDMTERDMTIEEQARWYADLTDRAADLRRGL